MVTLDKPIASGASSSSKPSPLARLLEKWLHDAARLELGPRQSLYEADDRAERIFLVQSGQLRTECQGRDGERRMIEILGGGDWLGAAALAGAACYGERAVAAVPSVVAALPVDKFLSRVVAHAADVRPLLRDLAAKLLLLRDQAAGLVFDDAMQRLIRTLLRLSNTAAATHGPDEVALWVTHQELSQAVGVRRETVTLTLAQLRRKGLVRTRRNRLLFDPAKLSAECAALA